MMYRCPHWWKETEKTQMVPGIAGHRWLMRNHNKYETLLKVLFA
jgi:hypothetical protein